MSLDAVLIALSSPRRQHLPRRVRRSVMVLRSSTLIPRGCLFGVRDSKIAFATTLNRLVDAERMMLWGSGVEDVETQL
jgi:hypothetical protein